MKKSLYSLLLVFISLCVSSAQTCTAVSVITLNPGGAGPIGAHMMVTYNPLRMCITGMQAGLLLIRLQPIRQTEEIQ